MSWHIDDGSLALYRSGRIGEVASFSLEAHLLDCEQCRGALSNTIDEARCEDIWASVLEEVDGPSPRVGERVLRKVGVPERIARLLALTPTLDPSWILSVLIVLAFAVFASGGTEGGPILFLILAPLVPVTGVAAAYGRHIDPVHEIALASPLGGFRLMLVRSAAVLMATVAVATLPALTFAELRWSVVWLLPGLALTSLTLILSTVTTPARSATIVVALWLGGLLTAARFSEPYVAFGASAQLIFAALAAGLAAALVARRHSFEHM